MSLLEPVVGRLVGDNTDYVRSLNDAERRTGGFADDTDRHFGRMGASIGKFAKVAAVGMGGAAVGVGLFLKKSVEAAEEARKVTAQTEAVIKSTGGAANVSADQVGKYADQLAALTGIDDEVIAGGQNLLLTFTNVRNELGKGNDVFNQGTKAALNMSVALKQDLQSSSMLVGKALNDPIKGVTALTRSGIQFTEQQKDQIKAMTESGNVLGAQKIILKELETQFGGSAEAAASPMERLKVVVGNLQEELGARFLPVIGRVATFLADKLPGALDAVGRAWSFLTAGFKDPTAAQGPANLLDVLFNLGAGVRKLVDQFKKWWPEIKETVLDAVDAIVGWVRQNWPEIKRIITETMRSVQSIIKGVVDVITTIWENFGSQITAVAKAAWEFIRSTIEAALKVIQGIMKTVTSLIHGDWSGVWEGIKMILAGAWDFIMARVQFAVDIVKNVISVALEIIGAAWSGAWNGIKDFFAGIWDRIYQLAREGVASIVDTFLGMVGMIIGAAESAFGWIPGIGGKLREAKDKFDEFRDGVNRALRGIEDRTVFVTVVTQGGDQRTYGGEIGGRTSPGIQLAEGGFVDKATMALIGEAGRELVLPLTDMTRTSQLLRQAGLLKPFSSVAGGSAIGGGGAGGRGGSVYTLNVFTATGDIPDETIRKIRSQLFELENDMPSAQISPG